VKALIKWEETFINVNGVKVAFTEAQRHRWKTKRSWTPFFGFGGNNPWLIKGVIDTQVNVNYDSTGIKSIPIYSI
jgi:hypothetical protein